MSEFATASGNIIDVNMIKWDMLSLDDIAHHLSKVQRFNGGIPINKTYSVAEHCINLYQHSLNIKISTLGRKILLLHDASEAYLADIPSPIKSLLPDYQKLEENVQSAIYYKYLNITSCPSTLVKELDKRILIDEVLAIMPSKLDLYRNRHGNHKKELGCTINYNNHPSTVKQYFLTICKELGISDE